MHLVGFHPMKDAPAEQMTSHHYCNQVNEDFGQCVLFDGDTGQANLHGIEYIISESTRRCAAETMRLRLRVIQEVRTAARG